MKKIIAVLGLSIAATSVLAISPSMLAKQQAAMTYGPNSNVRVVGNTIYVPTTTRFDNKAPTYSSAYQNTVSDAQSRGYSMNAAQSLAKNGPSYTSLNYANKGNAVVSAPAKTAKYVTPATTSKYVAPSAAKPVVNTASAGKICGYSGANYGCYSSASQLPKNFRR